MHAQPTNALTIRTTNMKQIQSCAIKWAIYYCCMIQTLSIIFEPALNLQHFVVCCFSHENNLQSKCMYIQRKVQHSSIWSISQQKKKGVLYISRSCWPPMFSHIEHFDNIALVGVTSIMDYDARGR